MDKIDSDLVNLHDSQADQPNGARVLLRATQEDTRMVKPEVVDRIRELSGQGLGSKRIARMLGISRNSVRRYLAGATVGFQERPAARRLDGKAPELSRARCCGSAAGGNCARAPFAPTAKPDSRERAKIPCRRHADELGHSLDG